MNNEIKEAIAADWSIDINVLKGCKILYSQYLCADYEGYGFVLYKQGGKLYEVNGSHCSCYGLEGQWLPEVTSKEALLHRLTQGHIYGIDTEQLLDVVKKLRK